MKKAFVFVAAVAAAGTVLAAGLGPQSYAQDGLVTQFDAIDNEGTGTYNPSAATWRDLKGSARAGRAATLTPRRPSIR